MLQLHDWKNGLISDLLRQQTLCVLFVLSTVFTSFKALVVLTLCHTCAFSSLSESFFMVKGAALFLQQGGNTQEPKTPTHHKHAGGKYNQ